jgi:hypothetical protein
MGESKYLMAEENCGIFKKKESAELVTIMEHGDTYSEVDEAANTYPFMLCPECTSEDTEIDLSEDYGMVIGDCRYVRKGIFEHRLIYVRHVCNSCGCRWAHEVEDADYKKGGGIVDDDIAAIIIWFLLFLLSLFFTVSFWMIVNNDSPVWVQALTTLASIVCGVFGVTLWFGIWAEVES